MSRAPIEAPLRYNDPASQVTNPAWVQWFQQEQDAIQQDISNKVDKVAGKGLSTNDYTDAEKTKLASLSAVAMDPVFSNPESVIAGTPVAVGIIDIVFSDPESQLP
jgi:hypothetical protein